MDNDIEVKHRLLVENQKFIHTTQESIHRNLQGFAWDGA